MTTITSSKPLTSQTARGLRNCLDDYRQDLANLAAMLGDRHPIGVLAGQVRDVAAITNAQLVTRFDIPAAKHRRPARVGDVRRSDGYLTDDGRRHAVGGVGRNLGSLEYAAWTLDEHDTELANATRHLVWRIHELLYGLVKIERPGEPFRCWRFTGPGGHCVQYRVTVGPLSGPLHDLGPDSTADIIDVFEPATAVVGAAADDIPF